MGAIKAGLVDRGEEFFRQAAVMVVPVAPAVEEPKPRHTCKHELGFTAVIQADITHVSPWQSNEWRTCPGCLYRRTQRAMNQLKHEQESKTLYALELDAAEWGKMRGRLKKREAAVYCAFPLEDGRFGVLHNQAKEGGDNLDTAAYADTFPLLQSWAATPEGKRVQTSKGWGGPWNGWKGNTAAKQEREAAEQEAAETGETLPPQVVVKGKASPAAVARHFGVQLKRGRRCTIEADWYTVYVGLLDVAGRELETIDGQPVLPALLNAFVEFSKEQDAAENATPAAENTAVQPALWHDQAKEGHEGEKSNPDPEPAPIHLVSWLSKGATTYAT